jgi:hypothetical protein
MVSDAQELRPSTESQQVDMSLAGASDLTGGVGNNHSQDVLKKFAWAIKQVTSENNADSENAAPQLTQEELIELIRCWEPQRDIICLYVRWARQLRRNFNLDSIATLLCLSRQCDYAPIDFLRKVKTLTVHKNQKAAYGATFLFDIPNRKDIKNRERLNKEFLGLSVTLALLEEQVTKSPSILGKTGMRQRAPRAVYQMNIPVNNNTDQNAEVVSHPTIEFHKQSSLLSRIWISISHRWMALYCTEHLFRENDKPWLYHDALVFSFQMMAPCGPGRFEFLSPLAGYCLRFRTQESIESKRTHLRQIWNDSSLFLSFGNTCLTQFSTEAKSRIIHACFQDLRSEIPCNFKQISYQRDCSWQRRWTMLCAYIFHFWLDAAANSQLKSLVLNQAARKKRKGDESHASPSSDNDKRSARPSTSSIVENGMSKMPPPTKQPCNGLQSILSSRRKSMNDQLVLEADQPTAVKNVGGNELLGSCNNNLSNLATSDTNNINGTPFKDIAWTSLRLIEAEEMQKFMQSFLLIHRHDGIDVLAELSPLEVYSANNLHDFLHCRLSGKSPFSVPRERISAATIYLRNDSDSFVDKFSKSYHVARGDSEYFREHGALLPSIHQMQLLCQAIVRHGSIDSKRAIGQYRLNLGNGGQNWVNGAPCELHGHQFLQDVQQDGVIDATQLLHAIGGITEFTWNVMCSLQHDANDHPIAPDTFRKQLYAEKLNKFLKISNNEIGFEDLTLVVSSLYPEIHQVSEHKDTMNDTLSGYTRTAAFNLVLIDDQKTPSILHLQVICNFRKTIGYYVVPFRKFIVPVANHARQYLDKWNHSIQSVFSGRTELIPSAYDRSTFYLDDSLPYEVVSISQKGKHKQSISAEYILTEINISRTLSLSMFIDPIVKLQRYLKMDQSIELAFACSFLSNPFWFEWSMSTLIRRLNDPSDSYELGLHPFYDWSQTTIDIFGGWQGGPYNRWSPCGGSKETILETFGALPSATAEKRKCGERKLSQVIAILWEHVEWINSMSRFGNTPVIDMPLGVMKAKCDNTIT